MSPQEDMAWVTHLQDVGIGLGVAYSIMRILKEAGFPRSKFDRGVSAVTQEYLRSQKVNGDLPPQLHELNAVAVLMASLHVEHEKAIEDQRAKSDLMAMQIKQLTAMVNRPPSGEQSPQSKSH